ncbi:unnamed protein product [Allacma fusca]|uniref:Uncharacterized protein n=1 Tax=Allacma fusca TaxID=39272 RepID=A0A8J2LLF0_9HEXA|nr:unnamed protein product [Allacma fusca]
MYCVIFLNSQAQSLGRTLLKMSTQSSVFCTALIFVFSWFQTESVLVFSEFGHPNQTGASNQISRAYPTSDNGTPDYVKLDTLNKNVSRIKRQSLSGLAGLGLIPNGNGNANSVESLLASCQLTNLLMYQLLQQKQQQSSFNPAIQPLAINQNLIVPQVETLTTYVTTNTYVTDMTTTALVTIPLLFGNKPVSTTITRTKTYQVTTSEVKTVTTTVRPTQTQLSSALFTSSDQIDPIPSSSIPEASSAALDLPNSKTNRLLEADELVDMTANRRISTEAPPTSERGTKIARNQRGKRRKGRPPGKIGTDNVHVNLGVKKPENSRRVDSAQYKILRDNRERSRTNPQQGSKPFISEPRDQRNRYFTGEIPQNPPPVNSGRSSVQEVTNSGRQRALVHDPDPEYVQYPDDYSYYARRLKRGQQRQDENSDFEDYSLDREYLLEPSFSADFSQSYSPVEKCPPVSDTVRTVTLTETHTVTKFVNPTSSSPSLRQSSSRLQGEESRRDGRSRSRFRSTTSTESTPSEQGARFRSRSRPQQDIARL